ncbi:MAG: hypothetical protein DMG12_00375 [Acidobacteria bacterium]|nr:MAG: hypothetical protein DMG12_00375 [Acidobacteriota bacterium]
MLAPANTLEGEHRKIAFYFIEAAAVPVSEFALFIEKCDCPPLALVVDEFGALDRLGPVKSTLKVRISESAEDATQLNEKPPVIPWSFRSLDIVLKLGRNAGCGEQTNNREKNARNLSQSPGHGTA